MASQSIAHKAGEMTEAQLKKDEIMNHASHGQATNFQSSDLNSSRASQATNFQSSDQNSTYTSQATNFLQQTGEQVKNIAQGAADAVKNTLGMNSADNASNAPNRNPTGTANPISNPNTSTNHPSNPSPRT